MSIEIYFNTQAHFGFLCLWKISLWNNSSCVQFLINTFATHNSVTMWNKKGNRLVGYSFPLPFIIYLIVSDIDPSHVTVHFNTQFIFSSNIVREFLSIQFFKFSNYSRQKRVSYERVITLLYSLKIRTIFFRSTSTIWSVWSVPAVLQTNP